jgi:hypothetical protein
MFGAAFQISYNGEISSQPTVETVREVHSFTSAVTLPEWFCNQLILCRIVDFTGVLGL